MVLLLADLPVVVMVEVGPLLLEEEEEEEEQEEEDLG
jgi:hypothetical protein